MRPEDPYCLDCGALFPDGGEGAHVCDDAFDLPPPQVTSRGRIYFAADIENARAEGAAADALRAAYERLAGLNRYTFEHTPGAYTEADEALVVP